MVVFLLLTTMPISSFASNEDGHAPTSEETVSKSQAPAKESSAEERFYRPNQSPYRVKPALELTLIVIGGVAINVPRLMVNENRGPWCGLECDVKDVNALDRKTMTSGSQTAADVSDYLMFGFLPLTFVFDAIDVGVSKPLDGWRGFGADALVLLETMGVTLYVNGLVAMIVRRPRPYVYRESESDDFRQEGEAAMSFYSGHTSIVFAAATAYSRLFMLRHPDSKLIAPVWIFTHGIAATVGALRLVSGAHFLTDVIVGAVSGVGFGLVIPWLHELPDKEDPSSHPQQARIHMRPFFSGNSAGLFGSFN